MAEGGNDNSFPYTSNEDLAEIADKDQTVELVGYVESMIAPQEVGQSERKYKLFKVVISNGSRKIMLLIWGEDLIRQYEAELKINRVIHIEGGTSKLANLNYRRDDSLIPFEIIIKEQTIVNYLGYRTIQQQAAPPAVTPVSFTNVVGVTGQVVIVGYLKTKFLNINHTNGNMSWGCGAITDGLHKINVQVARFVTSDIEKGTQIKVTGVIRSADAPVIINCQDMTSIRVIEGADRMPLEQLMRGIRSPPRPLALPENPPRRRLAVPNSNGVPVSAPAPNKSVQALAPNNQRAPAVPALNDERAPAPVANSSRRLEVPNNDERALLHEDSPERDPATDIFKINFDDMDEDDE